MFLFARGCCLLLRSVMPPAPGVFVYCAQYGVPVDEVAVALVLCTVASAPLMFCSSVLATLGSDQVEVRD